MAAAGAPSRPALPVSCSPDEEHLHPNAGPDAVTNLAAGDPHVQQLQL